MHLVAYPSCKSLPAAFERHRVVIPALLSLCLLLTAGSRTAHAQDRARPIVPPLTLGALYGNTPTGLRYLQGIKDAVAEHAIGSQVTIVRFPYANEAQGLDLLTEILTEKKADIVIGPTESGVFVNALKHGSELQKYEIPVISSLVTADIPHREFGWFFRTNSDVRRRSHAIFDFLNKYWVRSIALLYANTEFGRRAEEAFLRQLSSSQKERYLPLLYHSPPIEARNQIRQILATRPEAVGIIGEREDIRDIYESIERMNSWGDPYTPIFFTIVDVSLAGGHLNNFYFVSVTPHDELKGEPQGYDDVNSLAFDTTTLVLNQWQEIPVDVAGVQRRRNFRDQFEAVMRGSEPLPGSMTKLRFSRYENSTPPQVFLLHDKEITREVLRQPVGLFAKIARKYELLLDRYGPWPLINFGMLLLIVCGTTVADIRKWFSGSFLSLLKSIPFLLLMGSNLLIVGLLYIYMGETGNLRYDSTLATLALAVAPMAIIRATIFETKAGTAIGLGKYYDSFLRWVHHRLMLTKHTQVQKAINLISYSNTVDGMKSYLKEIYSNCTPAQRIRLETELEETVNSSLPYLRRRKECARLLTRTKKWEELQQSGLAPEGVLDDLQDPENLIRRAARQRVDDLPAIRDIENRISDRLARIESARRTDLEATLAKDLQDIVGQQGILRRKLAFLCVITGYDESYLESLVGGESIAEPECSDSQRNVNILAYHNTADGMRAYLKSFFDGFQNTEQRVRMQVELEEAVDPNLPYIERRKACARLLLRHFKWERLQQDGMAPVKNVKELKDPELIVSEAARRIVADPQAGEQLESEIAGRLESFEESRKIALLAALTTDLESAVGDQDKLRRKLAFLSVIRGYDEEFFLGLGAAKSSAEGEPGE